MKKEFLTFPVSWIYFLSCNFISYIFAVGKEFYYIFFSLVSYTQVLEVEQKIIKTLTKIYISIRVTVVRLKKKICIIVRNLYLYMYIKHILHHKQKQLLLRTKRTLFITHSLWQSITYESEGI